MAPTSRAMKRIQTIIAVTRKILRLIFGARSGQRRTRKISQINGSLPVNLAAQVCAAGATYWHLSLEVPVELRGLELSADDLQRLAARIERFEVSSFDSR